MRYKVGENGSSVRFELKESNDWANAMTASSDFECALNDTNCAEWVYLYSGGSVAGFDYLKKLYELLDAKIDNNDGTFKGKVRYIIEYL